MFAVDKSVNCSIGMEYKMAGGETSEINVRSRKYDQSLARKGDIKSHKKNARTKIYTTDPTPRCCKISAFGLSQYRPMPTIQVQTNPKIKCL